ncbi:hypothetical protein [Vibrio alginolyticus]|uniref:hypothetical protein n=1 Tax=Vibrio alginolyticus TaxID=663 RepID=UPI0015F407B0|nr:hypothetical protein [Vibrio alginolyticus]
MRIHDVVLAISNQSPTYNGKVRNKLGDLIFHYDVRSERDIKLAERLAKENDTELNRKDL